MCCYNKNSKKVPERDSLVLQVGKAGSELERRKVISDKEK